MAVDGLITSEYLKETAKRNIEGEITVDKVCRLVKSRISLPHKYTSCPHKYPTSTE